MSGFGGFGGFGQKPAATGGFGSTNNTSGFGSTNTNTGFGGFGSSGGGFGQNKTGFGATTGSLFGGGTSTASTSSGFGSFGNTSSTTTGGFGSGNTGGGLFGSQNKPATGFGNTTGGGLFGGGGTSSSGFGSNNTTTSSGFGGFAATNQPAQNNGTATTPFAEVSEKDAGNNSSINKYQTISTMDPYKQFSLEELRVVDYQQGRKQGNANGQAGTFGNTQGFGGFGTSANNTGTGFGNSTTGGGLFGSNNQQTTGGFGSGNTGGSLFGNAAKPATGGLFGNTTTSGQTGGGLFGTTTNTTGGFGSNNTTTGTTGGLFGNTAPKPAFGGFGSNTGSGFGSSTGTGFGTGAQATTGGGGLFGNTGTAASTGFGANNNASTSGFSFGQNNQTNNQQGQTGGGLFGGGGFGSQNNNQAKPGGLFGSTTNTTGGGGLFGNNNQQTQQAGGLFGNTNNQTQPTGGLFGNNNNNQTQNSGGLFGNNQQKPAGLFGSSTPNTGGGLFGNNQQQNNATGGGLFGSTNQPGGLFGSKPTQPTGLGSSLFGNAQQNSQPAAGGLFGNSQLAAPAAASSLFGGSHVASQPPQQPGALNASLLQNPYGNDALFANIGSPSQSVGPLATPLTSSQRQKKQTPIPAYKLGPANSSRLTTPQKRPPGYGFSYSTYGTPGSAITGGSPFGFSNMLSPPFQRSLKSSMSTSNLRHSFSVGEDSVMNPAAFQSVRSGTGRLKKLTIDRSFNTTRKSLFGTSTPEPRKSVSFDTGAKGDGSTSLTAADGALIRTESPVRESEPQTNGHVNGAVNGKELAVVPEDRSPEAPPVRPAIQVPRSHTDQPVGEYWSKPMLDEIKAMPADEKAAVENFEVGCKGQGKITFSKVNFNEVDVDKIFNDIVIYEARKVTVYGQNSSLEKPAPGRGLNVPSTITLANSWPRANAGATEVLEKKGLRYEKHLRRLKRIPGTTFINYDGNTGEWTFKVEHYTTYGLPDDDDDDESMLESSFIDQQVMTPTPLRKTAKSYVSPGANSEGSLLSPPDSTRSSPDDTFDFKKSKRKHLPGQFDDEETEDMGIQEEDDAPGSVLSFLGERSVGSSVNVADDASELSEAEGQEMVDSLPKPARTTGQNISTAVSRSILKVLEPLGTPPKGGMIFGDDWTEQLQRTVSPKKQNRAVLRASQAVAFDALDDEPTPKPTERQRPFATTMDIMNSLFDQSTKAPPKFRDSFHNSEVINKSTKIHTTAELEHSDEEFHHTAKPRWGPNGLLVYIGGPTTQTLNKGSIVERVGDSIVGEHNDVRLAKLNSPAHIGPLPTLAEQQNCTSIAFKAGDVPYATTGDEFEFSQFAEAVSLETQAGRMEHGAWELAHILFDEAKDVPRDLSEADAQRYALRLRKDRVSEFWKRLVRRDVQDHVARAESLEEKAFAYLTGGLVEEACNALIEGQNFHLATLVAQIGCDKRFRQAMSIQLDSWRKLNMLAEFEDAIRAIYELLAGNTCECRGKSAAGLENMAVTFSFSMRFNLDWRRSFGLRLWYGVYTDEDVTEAVLKYLGDLKDGIEEVKPIPWFVEQHLNTGWKDNGAKSHDDVLWSLLKLYCGDSFDLTAAFAPESVSGNPLDARLSFQLITLFQARSVGVAAEIEQTKLDALVTTFAAELASAANARPKSLISACWALLHLSDANAREAAIRSVLDQHAAVIDTPDGEIFSDLRGLRIPPKWIYLSKALYAHAVLQDPSAEAQALIDAQEWEKAHEVVCRVVGPLAVIENESDQLRELLGGLHDPAVKMPDHVRNAWKNGGELYYNFIEMRDLQARRGQRWTELVGQIRKALQRIHDEGMRGKELIERAALQIMAATIRRYAMDDALVGNKELFDAPVVNDEYLRESRRMCDEYFDAIVVG